MLLHISGPQHGMCLRGFVSSRQGPWFSLNDILSHVLSQCLHLSFSLISAHAVFDSSLSDIIHAILSQFLSLLLSCAHTYARSLSLNRIQRSNARIQTLHPNGGCVWAVPRERSRLIRGSYGDACPYMQATPVELGSAASTSPQGCLRRAQGTEGTRAALVTRT